VAAAAQLTEARHQTWLGEGSQTVQQQALRDLEQAFKNWWNNPGQFGRPTWRVRGKHEGFRIVGTQAQRWERLSRNRARVLVPKIGWVDWRWSRNPGNPKSYRITKDRSGQWWIAFAVVPEPLCGPNVGSRVGIDRGVAHAFVTSNGEIIDVPGLSINESARLLKLQRSRARQVKGSTRRARTQVAINRLEHRRINRRKDVVEKITTKLATQFDTICIEDLQIDKMTRSAKGTVECPGVGVATKRALNHAILSSGWGLFAQRLHDKAQRRVMKVSPMNTSRRCSACSHVAVENRKSQAEFDCVSCGYVANADVNAARNIAAGRAVTAQGGATMVVPMNCEPQPLLIAK
jgi:putative transposase